MTGDKGALSSYPCPYLGMGTCSDTCFQECDLQDIYHEHIKLLALRAAVLGDMTGEEAARLLRAVGRGYGREFIAAHRPYFLALADAVERMTP